ncbi:hypothetical protein [Zoogloea sp.]|uniref:hypothetical protein n=1 Tax=Zoogloea sp. TaxID=49181 RepID=UPI002630C411|nr:hypothetical protein [Zoogloea sp.]MDD3353010.1 hypothetical protein [Zoogloea sp.]
MAPDDLLACLIATTGTRQMDRHRPALDPASAPLDGRDSAALLAAARTLAGQLNYYETRPDAPSGHWQDFFPSPTAGESNAAWHARLATLAGHAQGQLPPHLALLIAFLACAGHPRRQLDELTRRHRDFQVQTVLGFTPRPPVADRVHLLAELKKGTAPTEFGLSLQACAGKDSSGRERIYRPVRPVVIGHARIARLASLQRDGDRLRFAPLADSADGLGAPLSADTPHWHPFGSPLPGQEPLPEAPVGFALASPLLRLAEGERKIGITLDLDGLPTHLDGARLAASFDARLTGPKGWLGPYSLQPAASSVGAGRWTFSLTLPADQPAVVDHQPALHPQAFPAGNPVLQLLLKDSAGHFFGPLSTVQVRQVSLSVQVGQIQTLLLESELGRLDPGKAFLPFGPHPQPGSSLHISCPEALSKRVSELTLELIWPDAPASQSALSQRYQHYSGQDRLAGGVLAEAIWMDTRGAQPASLVTLAPASGGRSLLRLNPRGSGHSGYHSLPEEVRLMRIGGLRARQSARALGLRRVAASAAPATPPRAGTLSLSLLTDLLHGAWRSEAVAGLLRDPPQVLQEPWTPRIQSLRLGYRAEAGPSRLDEDSMGSLTGAEIAFFHVDALGVARQHPWLGDTDGISLLPPHRDAGELLIGLSSLTPGDTLSLLFQTAEGSADPQARAQELQWAVLADNRWQPLLPGRQLHLDTTRHLRTSGIVNLTIPAGASTDNTRLPADLLWLRAAISASPGAACRLRGVHTNAIEAVFEDRDNAPDHLSTPLPAGEIGKFLVPPPTLKALIQPYASFGGSPAEDPDSLALRASERLRHRNRAITPWDYEHLVLDAFPGVERAKCIPHALPGAWFSPGCVTLVVIPDLRRRNGPDPLQPRVDLDTLEQIRDHLLARGGMGLDRERLRVTNPLYQPVIADFRVALKPGYAFNHYREHLNQALVQVLSPWAFDARQPLDFGGRVIRSALVDFIERLPWVDYVTDFRLSLAEAGAPDSAELGPDRPDALLVSVPLHRIAEVTP